MNTTDTDLKSRAFEALDKVNEWVEGVESFALEQAPLVAQEIVLLGRVQYTLGAVVSMLVIIIGVALIRKCVKIERNGGDGFGYAISGTLITAVSSVACALASSGALTAWLAPRVYLIEHISNIIK